MKEINIDNFILRIGQNQYENDELIKKSKQNDYWFHLKEHPSPHGVLEYHSNIPKDIFKKCAIEIQNHSKYPNERVIYTQIKNVIRTDKPGLVITKKVKIVK